jgi:hypothetical protein
MIAHCSFGQIQQFTWRVIQISQCQSGFVSFWLIAAGCEEVANVVSVVAWMAPQRAGSVLAAVFLSSA